MNTQEEISALLARLPDTPTYAEAFDTLQPLYNREVAPIIAQYSEPPLPHGQWRRDITSRAKRKEQIRVSTTRTELLEEMLSLPSDATPAETVDEAMYKLVLSYSIDRARQQIA